MASASCARIGARRLGSIRPRWYQPTVDKRPEDALERLACRDRGQDRKDEDGLRATPESGFPRRRQFLTPRGTRYGHYVDAPAVKELLVVAFEWVGAAQFGEMLNREGCYARTSCFVHQRG
jgi:hypothetical protein